ncbi:MAG TPA: hypothetical protein VEA80_05845 [Vitreimonas sp.]|uniref:hypothetical protein n=1 Tax=Vitreimonas sp. TaxID=3069702 RepID=UPI002D4F1691|nr:hypothetical protein [Vitreimonas sp.]HYD86975.1 hypothetical protein [Vitreimonas sp.]
MFMRGLLIAAALTVASIGGAFAQDEAEEIIVTGARLERYESLVLPAVTMTRRADAVLASATIWSDSRDLQLRSREIRATLEDMARRARASDVTISLQQDDVLRPFTVDLAMRLLTYGGRADSSQVVVQLRTATRGSSDTLDAARGRFNQFVESIAENGRASVDFDEDELQLTVIDLPQYRAPLMQAIVADGRSVAASMGEGFRPEIAGLESPVAFRRSGDLDLTLFINYTLRVVPVR